MRHNHPCLHDHVLTEPALQRRLLRRLHVPVGHERQRLRYRRSGMRRLRPYRRRLLREGCLHLWRRGRVLGRPGLLRWSVRPGVDCDPWLHRFGAELRCARRRHTGDHHHQWGRGWHGQMWWRRRHRRSDDGLDSGHAGGNPGGVRRRPRRREQLYLRLPHFRLRWIQRGSLGRGRRFERFGRRRCIGRATRWKRSERPSRRRCRRWRGR